MSTPQNDRNPAPLTGGRVSAVQPVNERLATLPVDSRRRVPIPFVQARHEDGSTDWTTIAADRVTECAVKRLCGLCGQPLAYWIAFIGGPVSLATRRYADPPMHVECATDAFTLCPHLSRPLVARRPNSAGGTLLGSILEKPERWAMGITRGFDWQFQPVSTGGYAPAFIAKPFKTVRWWEYRDGKAVEVTTS